MRILFTLLTICLGLSSWAGALSQQQALHRALWSEQTMGTSSKKLKALTMNSEFDLAFKDSQAQPAYYVFTPKTGQGYLIVSGDDATAPILGYCDEGTFDPNDMPENMRYWLSLYAEQISWARENGIPFQAPNYGLDGKDPIAPLLTTKWDQGAPYNDQCPEIDGTHCYTGCVATAMAQVMKFHNYPEQGTGSNSYTWNGETLSADFSQSTYDWDNMIDQYNTDQYTDEQAEAVALLMHDCGYSVNMDYGLSGSGAYSVNVLFAMPDNFSYDHNIFIAERSYHGLEDWNQLIYNQLAYVGPVYISASTPSGAGHAFLCDGYQDEGYFHINWGWSGSSNGYFLLDAMDPSSYGIGGSAGCYNQLIFVIGGIQPPSGQYRRYEIIAESFTVNAAQNSKDSYFNVSFDGLYNQTYQNVNIRPGVKIINNTTGECTWVECTSEVYSILEMDYLEMTSLSSSYSLPFMFKVPQDLENGNYTVTAAWKNYDTNEWTDVSVSYANPNTYQLIVEDDQVTIPESTAASLSCSDLQSQESLIWGDDCELSFTLCNEGDNEFIGYIRAALYDGDTLSGRSVKFLVDVKQHSEESFETSLKFNDDIDGLYPDGPNPGEYDLVLVDGDGNIISNKVKITIIDSTSIPDVDATRLFVNYQTITWDTEFTADITFTNSNSATGETEYYLGMVEAVPVGNDYYSFGNLLALSPLYTTEITGETTTISRDDFKINELVNTTEIPEEGLYFACVFNKNKVKYSSYCFVNFYHKAETTPVESVIVTPDTALMYVGDTIELTAIVYPEDATNKSIIWSSSDENVATVDQQGVVTAVGKGEATITAESVDGPSATCAVTVNEVEIQYSISLNASQATLSIGETFQLIATLNPSDDEATMEWKSSDSEVATVDANGLVTAVSGGIASITVEANGASATCEVTVNKLTQEIIWEQNFDDAEVGDEITLTAYATSGEAVTYAILEGNDFAELEGNVLTILVKATITIEASQQGNNIYLPAEPVQKKLFVETGIDKLAADNLKIATNGLVITIQGLSPGTMLDIFTPDAKLIYHGSEAVVSLPSRGTYLICIQGQYYKINI